MIKFKKVTVVEAKSGKVLSAKLTSEIAKENDSRTSTPKVATAKPLNNNSNDKEEKTERGGRLRGRARMINAASRVASMQKATSPDASSSQSRSPSFVSRMTQPTLASIARRGQNQEGGAPPINRHASTWQSVRAPRGAPSRRGVARSHTVSSTAGSNVTTPESESSETSQVKKRSAARPVDLPLSVTTEVSDVPLHQVYRVKRFYSFWRTCTNFHRIVTMISLADCVSDEKMATMSQQFKSSQRIFVQYVWRSPKTHEKECVAREFDPKQQTLLKHVKKSR